MASEWLPSYLATASLQKIGGSTGSALPSNDPPANTQWVFPNTQIVPYNILGVGYPGVVAGNQYPSVSYLGKKRPGFTLFMFAKPPTLSGSVVYGQDASFFNACLFNRSGTPAATDKFSMRISNTNYASSRQWDWARCTHIVISAGASGGPCVIQAGFISRGGESEFPWATTLPDGEVLAAAPSWTSPAVASMSGELDDVIDYDFRSDSGLGTGTGGTWTAAQVLGFTLHLVAGQGYVDYMDGSRFAKDVSTGMFSGALSLQQNPLSSTIPSSTATLRLHTNSGTNKGVKFTLLLKKDSQDQPVGTGIEVLTTNYTLFDQITGGGNPATCANFTPA